MAKVTIAPPPNSDRARSPTSRLPAGPNAAAPSEGYDRGTPAGSISRPPTSRCALALKRARAAASAASPDHPERRIA